MFTWSENPKKDMLQHLEMFAYKNNCKKLISGKIEANRSIKITDRKILNKKAEEISFCIKQGIEFFKNSENADISISPLLIYYGILSLSKALIISNSDKDIYLDDIKYHGLSTRAINEKQELQKKSKSKWKLLNEYANVNDGVFMELSKIFNIKLNKGYTFKLKNKFICIPELKDVINKFKIIESKVMSAYGKIEEIDSKINFFIYDEEALKLESYCPEIKKEFIKEYENKGSSVLEYKSVKNLKLKDFKYLYNYTVVEGGRYYVPQTIFEEKEKEKKILLNQILLDYINFFILSEQVRYHQDNWNKVLNGENDAVVSILKIYIEKVKRKFPNLILNELFGERFNYGTAGYLV